MDDITQYIIATTNFYGISTPEIIVNIYNLHHQTNLKINDVIPYIENPPRELDQHYVFVEKGLFVHEVIFADEDELIKLIEEKNDKPYYIPEKEHLLQYLETDFMEKNEQYDSLYTYLAQKISNEELVIDICDNFVFALKDEELNFGFILYQLNTYGICLQEEEDFDEFVEIVADLGANVRMWANNGYTLKELFEVKIHGLLHVDSYRLNLEPNIPCYCHSGLPYKDCCMKKDEKVKHLEDYRD